MKVRLAARPPDSQPNNGTPNALSKSMTDSDSTASKQADPLLAPPPFGVAETTGEQVLPMATSMEELLASEEEIVPAGSEPLVALDDLASPAKPAAKPASPAVAAAPARKTPMPQVAATTSEEGGTLGRTVTIGIVVGLLLGGAAWMFLRDGGNEATPVAASTDAPVAKSSKPPRGDSIPTETREAPATAEGEEKPAPMLPDDLEALRKLPYAERHALLSKAGADVNIVHHVGLDLVQAASAPTPCRTFADALGTIEASEDQEPFAWALEEAVAPTGDDRACTGLPARLAALQAPQGDAESTTDRRKSRRGRNNRRTRPAKPSGAGTPPPAAEPPKEPKAQNNSPKKPSVATKLDDDLKGLGD